MSVEVKIDVNVCTGCGACVDSCPTDVIRMKDLKAHVRYAEDCQGCSQGEGALPSPADRGIEQSLGVAEGRNGQACRTRRSDSQLVCPEFEGQPCHPWD